MAERKVSCPNCGAQKEVEVDLYGIDDGSEPYHQSEDCDECKLPFVVIVRAKFEWRVGKIEWEGGDG